MQHTESEIIVKVFISYTHEDHELRKKLEEHLSPLLHSGKITIWQDQEIPLGANWKKQIDTNINEADLILLLVSASFIHSNFCWNEEVLKALERDQAGEARVIPIILKPVDWQETPLGQLHSLPVDAKPVTLWNSQDEALHNVAQGIRNTVEDLRSKLREDALGTVSPPLQKPSLPFYRRLSRRTVVLGLTGVATVSGGLTWLGVSQGSQNPRHPDPDMKGKWVTTGSILQGRFSFRATTLRSNKVLIEGGNNGNGQILTESELFDVSTGNWTKTGTLNVGRFEHTATLLQDGRVLVVGGFASRPLTLCELYDPASGTWTPSDRLSEGRTRHTATLLKDGKVLAAGGWYGDPIESAEIYDPNASRWSSAGKMLTTRSDHCAVLLGDGKVLVAGGAPENDKQTVESELYDATINTWTATGNLNIPRSYFTTVLLPNGKVLAIGGATPTGPTATVELYDPATNSWSLTGGMKHPRTGLLDTSALLLPDGRVLVAGGDSSGTSEIYMLGQGTWIDLANIGQVHDQGATVLLNDGRALIVGGNDGSSSGLVLSAAIYMPD